MEEEKKEKKSKKGIIIAIIITILLIIIGVLSYFLFFGEKITINTDGGKLVQNIEIKDNEITTLPVIEKEGYKVVAYVNENKKIVKKGSKVTSKTKITPVYVKDDEELINVIFFDGEEEILKLTIAKGMELILPEDPVKEGYTFGGWKLENDMILIGNPLVDTDLKLSAIWISNDKEMVTVTIISNNQDKTVLGKYKQEKGSKLYLPSPTKKEGMVFEEWKDDNDNMVTNETILEDDIIIHAVFAKYTCPDDCKVNDDGKTCTKTETKGKETKKVCPDGAFEYYGKCITMKGAVSANIRQCDGDMSGRETYYNNYCVKVLQKVTKKVCPSGYKEDGDSCKKETIVNCAKDE